MSPDQAAQRANSIIGDPTAGGDPEAAHADQDSRRMSQGVLPLGVAS